MRISSRLATRLPGSPQPLTRLSVDGAIERADHSCTSVRTVDDLPVGWMMVVGRVQMRAVCAVMQMMIRTALTALLTASRTGIASDVKIENYENYFALRHPCRN